jgi:ABC-type nitrate/sulfonate/bicarbonate transport system ATPase subunit
MVFQKDTLLPWLSVEENAGLAFRFRANKGIDRVERESRITALLELAKLADFRKAYPHELSGGMRRRLALVAAVAPQPQLLLLDEPFSSVDEPTRIAIHQDLLEIIYESSISTVLVTHDLAEAISLSDQVAILTRRPTTVASVHDIPFGRDRNVLQLRESEQYLAQYGELWSRLSEEISRSGDESDQQ